MSRYLNQVEVLVSTVQGVASAENMNINTNAIIINQSDSNVYREYLHKGNTIRHFSFAERGVGLSRNTALMRSDADICVFADDDVVYYDDYASKVKNAYLDCSDADVIIFNLDDENEDAPIYQIRKKGRVRLYNCLRYGAARLTVSRDRVLEKNIYFSLLFGGGAKYSNGEDSLFIFDCIKKGLKVYAVNISIGVLKKSESTWFEGYSHKYFRDRYVLYKHIFGAIALPITVRFLIKIHRQYKRTLSFTQSLRYSLTAYEDSNEKD